MERTRPGKQSGDTRSGDGVARMVGELRGVLGMLRQRDYQPLNRRGRM